MVSSKLIVIPPLQQGYISVSKYTAVNTEKYLLIFLFIDNILILLWKSSGNSGLMGNNDRKGN